MCLLRSYRSRLPISWFTLSSADLEAECKRFGPIEYTNLLMDKDNVDVNAGRAYVTFETAAAAEKCLENCRLWLEEHCEYRLHPRIPNAAVESPWDPPPDTGKKMFTKCFCCDKVGHMEADCPNPAKPRPCPLCAGTDHDMRSCPYSRICFLCGMPGHINCECASCQNLPKCAVCGICLQKWSSPGLLSEARA